MVRIELHEAAAKLPALVQRAESGEEIVITRRGEPVVQLVATNRGEGFASLAGAWRGQVKISEEFR
jgi:prevent-host-death family protein